MHSQEHSQVLRIHLLDMSKLSQRAVDYAIKGYKLGSPEFCRYSRHGDHQLSELRRKIIDLCRQILMEELYFDPEMLIDELDVDSKSRFPLSALRICRALYGTCLAAAEIAHNTMLLLEDARPHAHNAHDAHAALEKACHLVNRLMSLCIVALFKQEIRHAEAVLESREAERLFQQALHHHRDITNRRTAPPDIELAITRSLGQIARQSHEIAEAIVFWLEGKQCALEVTACAHP
jgi:phosphate uptake regulator